MRHILEGLKRNVRGHAEICLLIIFSSRGCVVVSPIFLSNFPGWCPNHEKTKKTCTFGWYPEVWLSRHGLTFSWWGMIGKGKVSKDRTAKCSQKQTGSQVNDTFMQNETTTKKIKQENQEDLLGQSASDIGLFFFVFFGFCFQFCMPQGKDAESWVLSFACFLVSQCICQNRECEKRSAKSARWWSPGKMGHHWVGYLRLLTITTHH